MVEKSQDTLARFSLEGMVERTEEVISKAVQAKKA
jgi:hypothetical protein